MMRKPRRTRSVDVAGTGIDCDFQQIGFVAADGFGERHGQILVLFDALAFAAKAGGQLDEVDTGQLGARGSHDREGTSVWTWRP
jgi:hypothetical protein